MADRGRARASRRARRRHARGPARGAARPAGLTRSRRASPRVLRYDAAAIDPVARGPRQFVTTHWSLVLAATPDEASRSRARQALEALCRDYWYPLYVFVRCRGHAEGDAQDLTQAFFAGLIERGGVPGADPARGRFRSYLLGAMKHFLANERARAAALKRGGDVRFVDLDAVAHRAAAAPTGDDPDAVFDREWAREVTIRARERLRLEWEARGKGRLYEALEGALSGGEMPRGDVAERLGMTEGALKVAIHRLRRRYREIVQSRIAETVPGPADIEGEMRHLIAALRHVGGDSG